MDKAMHSEFEGHTPGPWRFSNSPTVMNDKGVWFKPVKDSFLKCNVEYDGREIIANAFSKKSERNCEANAKLIAAAPDLLKENQSLRSELQSIKAYHEERLEAWHLELQKQKELNAELVKGLEYIKKLLGALSVAQDTPEGQAYYTAESLIKKSKES